MLINITDKIAELEKQRFSCTWERLEFIDRLISEYKTKLANGITFEPAF